MNLEPDGKVWKTNSGLFSSLQCKRVSEILNKIDDYDDLDDVSSKSQIDSIKNIQLMYSNRYIKDKTQDKSGRIDTYDFRQNISTYILNAHIEYNCKAGTYGSLGNCSECPNGQFSNKVTFNKQCMNYSYNTTVCNEMIVENVKTQDNVGIFCI